METFHTVSFFLTFHWTPVTALPRFGTVLLGQRLADRKRSFDRETYLSLIDVLKEELFSAAAEHRKTYVGCVVAAYVAYVRINDTKGTSFSAVARSQ